MATGPETLVSPAPRSSRLSSPGLAPPIFPAFLGLSNGCLGAGAWGHRSRDVGQSSPSLIQASQSWPCPSDLSSFPRPEQWMFRGWGVGPGPGADVGQPSPSLIQASQSWPCPSDLSSLPRPEQWMFRGQGVPPYPAPSLTLPHLSSTPPACTTSHSMNMLNR